MILIFLKHPKLYKELIFNVYFLRLPLLLRICKEGRSCRMNSIFSFKISIQVLILPGQLGFSSARPPRLFSWAVWHSCRMGVRNQEQTRGRIGPQLRLGNLRVGELHFCPLWTALDQASSLSRKLAYVPGPTFGFVKLLASSGSHCTKWADEQHWQAEFESRLVPDLPLPFIPTLIGLRAFDLKSCLVGGSDKYTALPPKVKDRFEAEGFPASAGPPLGGRAALLAPVSSLYSTGPCCPV